MSYLKVYVMYDEKDSDWQHNVAANLRTNNINSYLESYLDSRFPFDMDWLEECDVLLLSPNPGPNLQSIIEHAKLYKVQIFYSPEEIVKEYIPVINRIPF